MSCLTFTLFTSTKTRAEKPPLTRRVIVMMSVPWSDYSSSCFCSCQPWFKELFCSCPSAGCVGWSWTPLPRKPTLLCNKGCGHRAFSGFQRDHSENLISSLGLRDVSKHPVSEYIRIWISTGVTRTSSR